MAASTAALNLGLPRAYWRLANSRIIAIPQLDWLDFGWLGHSRTGLDYFRRYLATDHPPAITRIQSTQGFDLVRADPYILVVEHHSPSIRANRRLSHEPIPASHRG
ncbi:hypothetical protein [Pseudomonas phage PfAC20]